MAFRDIREFVKALDKTGDVVHIQQEVDWDLEAGAILRHVYETGGPAPFFEKVKDYPPGFRLFGGPLGTFRRFAIALGLDPKATFFDIVNTYEARMAQPIKPIVVRDGPCQENVLLGDKVDILQFPVPMLHDGDGGRYFTCHAVAARDPDSAWINWGLYRLMVHNRRHLGGLVLPFGDMGSLFYQKYVPYSRAMPIAIVFGGDPLIEVVAQLPIPTGESEVDYAGGLRQEPVELVKCQTNDILVPADAEIVFEGELLPDVTVEEGPFGEYSGYRTSPRAPRSVYRINAITYRDNPILPTTCNGIPIDDHLVLTVGRASEIKRTLLAHKIPVTGVYMPNETVYSMVIVGVKTLYSNIATQIADMISGTAKGGLPNWVVVVNEDVDITDLNQVLHAMVTKCHPVRGIRVVDHAVGAPLQPSLNYEERKWGRGARVLFDCTWPLDWSKENVLPPRVAFNSEDTYPSDIREKVLASWASYGFKRGEKK